MSRQRVGNSLGRWIAAAAAALSLGLAAPAASQTLNRLPVQAEGVDIVDRLGERIPDSVVMRTAEGEVVDLADYFKSGKPAVLALVYYDCPLVCPLILERLTRSVSGIDFDVGEDFNLIVVSFDPTNTDAMALEAKRTALLAYDREITPQVERGFAYHTASEGNVGRLAEAVGYEFKRLPNGEYSHPSVLIVLSPEGVVTRYLPGFDAPSRDLKLALLEASKGAIAQSVGDWFLHRCFSFDPSKGSYGLAAMKVMRLAGGLSVVVLSGMIAILFVRERVRRFSGPRAQAPAAEPATAGQTP